MQSFGVHTQVKFGDAVGTFLAALTQERVLIGCDPFLVADPLVANLIQTLNTKNQTHVFADVVPDPPLAKVAAGVSVYHAFQPTVVLAIGGGSAIDTMKAVRYCEHFRHPADALASLYVMPSTSGTGSEVTSFAVITDPDAAVKYPLFDALLQPDVALLLPEIVKSCPPKVCAYSGMDTLTHGLEALVATGATRFTDGLATQAIALTFRHLGPCFAATPEADYAAMQQAACIAGMAFDNAGVGLSHAIAHQLGSQFHLPHGLANAIMLPHIIAFNAKDARSAAKYAAVNQIVFPEGEQGVPALIAHVQALSKQLACPQSLRACEITTAQVTTALDAIVNNAMHDFTFAGNPVAATKADVVKLVLAVL
ncbi:iron-containing alcohol dehydrogenase [Lacticaseibacillus sp. GG6-2]